MIDKNMLDEVLEGLLLVSGGGLKVSEVAEHLEVRQSDVNDAVKRLKQKYGGKCGINILTFNGKIQFASNPAYSDLIACVLNPIRERELSNAALETIAIIAYRQPVTRLDIEQIRGVNSEYTVQQLLKNNLIEVVGRKEAVGKPLLFGTTDEFLKRFGLENLSDLPDYETLLESIKVIGGQSSSSIYKEFEIPEEEQTDEVAASADESAGLVTEENGSGEGENARDGGENASGAVSGEGVNERDGGENERGKEVNASGAGENERGEGVNTSAEKEDAPASKNKRGKRARGGKQAADEDDFEFPEEEIPDFLKGEENLQRIE